MEYFLREPGRIFSRELLAEKVWGLESEAEYNNIEVYISFSSQEIGIFRLPHKVEDNAWDWVFSGG
ncbi:MAG: winged helix-turn-helix domain-containing protein [Ruthenibacterium sp.]